MSNFHFQELLGTVSSSENILEDSHTTSIKAILRGKMNKATTSSTPPSALPYTAIVAAVILWGGSFAAMRSGISEIGALSLMSLRSLTAAIVILPLAPKFFRSFKSSYKKKDWKLLLLTVLLQPCIYFLFESNALRFTTASQAGMVSATAPILTAFGAWVVLREPFGKRLILGMVLAVAGIAIITFGGNPNGEASRPLLGNILEFSAMICAAGNLVAVRGLSQRYSTWVLTALQTTAGAIFFFPGLFGLIQSDIRLTDLPIIPILYLGIASSLIAFGLYNWSMGRIPAARASSFINLVPVVSACGAWLLLGERLTQIQIVGSAVVLLGVLLGQKKRLYVLKRNK